MLDSVNGVLQIIYKQQKSETLPVNICRLTQICIAKLLVFILGSIPMSYLSLFLLKIVVLSLPLTYQSDVAHIRSQKES